MCRAQLDYPATTRGGVVAQERVASGLSVRLTLGVGRDRQPHPDVVLGPHSPPLLEGDRSASLTGSIQWNSVSLGRDSDAYPPSSEPVSLVRYLSLCECSNKGVAL